MAFGFDDFAVAVGLTGLAKEVLWPLLKGSLEDYTKDFFKGCIEDIAGLAAQEPVQKAMGKALKAFVELMTAELEYAGLTGAEIRDFYQPALRAYMKDADVKATLGAAFEPDCKAIDDQQLRERWTELDLRQLPDDFDWEQISKQYVRKVKGIWRESPELRELLTLHNQEAIRQGVKLLVGIEPDSAFWKYFAAWAFVFRFEKAQEISFDELLKQTFAAHWQDERWHEVLRLIAGMLKPQHVEKIIEFLLAQNIRNEPSNVFLAADCLAGIRQRSELNKIAERVWNSVEALVQFDLDYYYKWHEEEKRIIDIRTKAVTTISSTWTESPRTIAWLKACAQFNDNYYVRIAAVQELARNFKDDPDILPILRNYAQSDKDYFMRRAAIQELAQSFKDDPDTLLLLKTCTRSEEDSYVREAAVNELAKGFNDHPDTMPLLKELIQSNEDLCKDITIYRTVRSVALKGLVCSFKDDPDTLPILKKRAQYDKDPAVRREALQQLTQWFKDDPDTLAILKKRAKHDRDYFVKEIALEKLAQCFKDDPDTLSTLKKRAQFASNFHVRYVALRELMQVFKDDPDTLPILKKQIQSEHTPDHSRSLMIYLLSKHFKDDPDTLIFLKLYAQSEEYKYLRQTALEELSKGFKDDPDTLNILKKRAELDKDIHVQETAVRELTRSLKDHPDTLRLLKLLAQSENASTRCIAVQALTIHYKDEPNVLSLLKERAELDKFYLVRNAAMKTLARELKDDLGLYELLYNCVYHDPYKPRDSLIFRRRFYYRPLDYNPRFHALKALVQQFPCHPKTYELLTDRTQHDNDKYLRSWASEHLAKINLDK